MAASGKVPRRRSVTREQLLISAEACFLDRGFQGSSVEWLAAEAGYTPGAIYSSFGDKAGLFLAVLERRAEAQLEQWRKAAASPDAEYEVSKMLEQQLTDDEWMRWSSAYYEFYAFAVREPEVMSAFKALFQYSGKGVGAALETLAARSSIPAEDFIQLVRAATNGLSLIALLDDRTDVSNLMATLLTSLRAPAPDDRKDTP